MKKILYILIGLLIVPTFVFAAEKEIGTMEKFMKIVNTNIIFMVKKVVK